MPSQRCSPNVPQNRDTAGASSRKLACRTTAGTAPQTGADTSSLADSAYASMAAPSNTSNTSIGMQRIDTPRNALGDVGSEGRLIAGTGYRTFLGLGTPAAKQHYRIVRGPISDSIKQYLDDTHTKPLKMWAVVPKLIGNSEAEATLHLVVLCEPDLESTIRSCFTQQHILAMLSYKNGGKLNFLIIPQCPKSRSATLDISVHCHDYFPSTRTTYCGVSLILEDMVARSPQNKAHRATFGGIVKALYGNGETAFFGVTAGHAVAEVSCLREERDTATNAITSELQSSPEGHRVSPTALGRVLDYKQLPGVSAERAKQTHDWAIFEVDTILRNEAIGLNQDRNRIQEDGNKPCHSISKAAHPTFHDGASDPVLLLNGAHESLRGELSELPARVWISHTAEFVDCYILDLDEGEICDGDSGAWVVHNAAPELYGHLTATDIFGSAYVIPALNTFDNIRDCLGAVSVTLPAVADLNQGRSSESNEVEDSALPEDTRDSSRFGINRIWSSAAPCTEDQTPSTPNSQANNQRYPSKQDHMPPAPSREPFQKFSSITAKRWSAQLSRNECPEWAFDSWFEHLDFSYTNNPLELFMESYQNPLELHTSAVIKFCADAQHTDLVDCYEFGRVWLDDRHDACLENVEAHGPCEIHEKPSRNYPGLLTAHQLREHLKIPRYNHPVLPDAHRRLIYVPDLSPQCILALVETARAHERDALRDILRSHITLLTSLRVQTCKRPYGTFHLAFHMPYFAPCRITPGLPAWCRPHRKSISLDFLVGRESLASELWTLYEGGWSLMIIGTGERRWTAFCFSDTYYDPEWEPCEDEMSNQMFTCDPIASYTGAIDANLPIWNAREYFLVAICNRMECISEQWRTIGRIVEIGVNKLKPAQDLSHEKLAAFITCLSDTGSLLDELLHRISESTNSWNRFAADDGDWQYFSPSPGCPLPSENIGHYLVELGETFKDLEEVQKSLQDSKWRVDSLKTSLSLHLKQETRGAKKRNDYVADMTILIVAPIAVTSVMFSTPPNVMQFARETRSFLVTVLVITILLLLLRLAPRMPTKEGSFAGNIIRFLKNRAQNLREGLRNGHLPRNSRSQRRPETVDTMNTLVSDGRVTIDV